MTDRVMRVVLTGNSTSLQSALLRASREILGFGRATDQVSLRSLAGFAGKLTLATAGVVALERGISSSIRAAVAFDAAMRNVNSISGLTEAQFRSLSSSVLDLSTRVPQSATNLANGLYEIASSGFQGAQGLTILKASALAASAGLTDTRTASQTIVGAINAYGLAAKDAGNVSDSLFQTVNLGVLSFADLAEGMGQVIGTAAASKVPLNDLGAAIAAITRAGVIPAEAFTSLNRVLIALIKPSEALQQVYRQLGYESGESALKTKGLRGVMEDLRRVTGGSSTALLELFQDQRAVRGAFALMSNAGQTYAETSAGFTDKTEIAGRTLRTFHEQMKSTAAQWQLFKNRAAEAGIVTATFLLPVLNDTLHFITSLGEQAVPLLTRGLGELAPFFRALRDIGVDIADLGATLVHTLGPLSSTLGGGAFLVAAAGLNLLAEALAAVTGFADRHHKVVAALAILYLSRFIPAIVLSARAMAANVVTALFGALLQLTLGVGAAAEAFLGLATAEGIASAALVGIGVLAAVGMYNLSQATKEADRNYKQLISGFKATDASSAEQALHNLGQAALVAGDHFNKLNRFQRGLAHFGFGPGTEDLKNLDRIKSGIDEVGDATLNTYKNANRLADQLGLTGDQVLAYVRTNHIDLSKPWDDASDAIDQVKAGLANLATESGVSTQVLQQHAGQDIDAIKALADAMQAAGDAAKKAFDGANDTLANFHPDQAAKDTETATKALKDARDALAQLTSGTRKHAVSEEELGKARDRVTQAQKKLNEAQKAGDLGAYYRDQIAQSKRFLANITDATRRGLDPGFIARLLQAGPAQAGPILDQIVGDHSGRLIKLVDSSEKALSAISLRAVHLARLTQLALSSNSSKAADDLGKAQAIELERLAHPSENAYDIGKALHIKPSEVARIANEFGIVLSVVQSKAAATPINVRVRFTPDGINYYGDIMVPDGKRGGSQVFRAYGGPVYGAGTSTSDSIPAWLSHGEYVQQAAAVRYYGLGFMEAINSRTFPKYAAGGYVAPLPRWPAGGGLTGTTTPTLTQYVTKRETHIGEVRAHDYHDFERQMRAREQLEAVTLR